jgi:hypothetical protein
MQGCNSSEPDPVVSASVGSAVKMPFHGPQGPGGDSISITFKWTVSVWAAEGPECRVTRIATEVVEPLSGKKLEVASEPGQAGLLRGGVMVELPQQHGGFFDSTLYSRRWTGRTRVDVSCEGGWAGQIEAVFAFE